MCAKTITDNLNHNPLTLNNLGGGNYLLVTSTTTYNHAYEAFR